MFAEHDAVFAPDQLWIETLIVVGMLEQAIDVDSGLMREHARADHALLPGYRTRRRAGDQFRKHREAAQIDTGFNAIALAQAKHDFLQRRIAGALAEAVDRRIQMRCPCTGRRQCVGYGQPEIVVRVHFDVEIGDPT